MNRIVYRTTLDLHEPIEGLVYDVTQNDSATEFVFAFREDRKAYHITDGTEVVLRAVKPDGTVLYNNCVVADDTATYKLTSQTSAAVGIVECELVIYSNNGEQLTSPRFAIRVHENLYSDSEVESEDEFTELQTAMASLENLDVDVSRSGDTTTITITHKDGTQSTANVYDGNNLYATFHIDEDGHLIRTEPDDYAGPDFYLGNDGHLYIKLNEEGEPFDLGLVKGQDGQDGQDGAPGADGEDGEDGSDGVSVVSLSINAQKHLICTLSNGQTVDAGVVPSGTSDHSQLTNRNTADQHPISAITGLSSALSRKADKIPFIVIDYSQVIEVDPVTAQLTDAQAAIMDTHPDVVFFDMSAFVGAVIRVQYSWGDSTDSIYTYLGTFSGTAETPIVYSNYLYDSLHKTITAYQGTNNRYTYGLDHRAYGNSVMGFDEDGNAEEISIGGGLKLEDGVLSLDIPNGDTEEY